MMARRGKICQLCQARVAEHYIPESNLFVCNPCGEDELHQLEAKQESN